jgi:Zn-dependent peptidase ImmA (M78 family)
LLIYLSLSQQHGVKKKHQPFSEKIRFGVGAKKHEKAARRRNSLVELCCVYLFYILSDKRQIDMEVVKCATGFCHFHLLFSFRRVHFNINSRAIEKLFSLSHAVAHTQISTRLISQSNTKSKRIRLRV